MFQIIHSIIIITGTLALVNVGLKDQANAIPMTLQNPNHPVLQQQQQQSMQQTMEQKKDDTGKLKIL